MRKSTVPILLLLVLVLILSACQLFGIGDTEPELLSPDMLNTQVALAITQTAISQPIVPSDTPEATPIPEADPEPTETEVSLPYNPVAVTFENVSFLMPDYLADYVGAQIVPAVLVEESGWPAELHPDFVQLDFEGYALSESFHQPQIRVYPVQEYKAISDFGSDRINEFQQFMSAHAAIVSYSTRVPMIVFWNAGQVFNSNFAYADFKNGSGYRFISMYAQALYPIDNYNIFFTYQGMTDDGKYYISIVLPIKTIVLPDRAADPIDYQAFVDGFNTYLATTSALMNNQGPSSFYPDLDILDAMIGTIEITP